MWYDNFARSCHFRRTSNFLLKEVTPQKKKKKKKKKNDSETVQILRINNAWGSGWVFSFKSVWYRPTLHMNKSSIIPKGVIENGKHPNKTGTEKIVIESERHSVWVTGWVPVKSSKKKKKNLTEYLNSPLCCNFKRKFPSFGIVSILYPPLYRCNFMIACKNIKKNFARSETLLREDQFFFADETHSSKTNAELSY